MGCAPSIDQQDVERRIASKFHAGKLDGIKSAADSPQVIVARIGNISDHVLTPYFSNACAFYRIRIEERSQHGSVEKWVHYYTEEKAANFYLLDVDSPSISAYVPGKRLPLKCFHRDDKKIHGTTNGILQFEEKNAKVESLFHRFHLDMQKLTNYRFIIHTFSFNDLVAILGVVQSGFGHNGEGTNVIVPVSQSSISPKFYNANKWSEGDMADWCKLTIESRIFISNDPAFIQGISTSALPGQYNTSVKIQAASESKERESKDESSHLPPHPPKNNENKNIVENENRLDFLKGEVALTSKSNMIKQPICATTVTIILPADTTPGQKIRVPGPDGNSVLIEVPLNSAPGQLIEIQQDKTLVLL